jgi:hypothetical protein
MWGLRTTAPRRWSRLLVLGALVSVVPTGIGAIAASAGASSCGTGSDLVPTCGILWGAHSSSGAATLEQAVGRRLAIVHDYTQWSSIFPTSLEKSEAAAGSIIYVDWTARDYSTNQPAATWAGIASGAEDPQINAEAAAVKAFGQPMMLTFQAEPEQTSNSVYGTSSDYVSAWRHIHDVFAADGVTNVVWVWDVEGDPSAHDYTDWYPGDSYVDWIMWDPYNWYGCNGSTAVWRSFSQIVSPMYTWLTENSGTPGNGDYLSKPWGLGEFGTVEGPTPTAKEQWFEDAISSAQQSFPNLKALVYFDSTDSTSSRDCPWVVDSSSDSLSGYEAAGDTSYASAMLSSGSGTSTTTTTTTTTLASGGDGVAPSITLQPLSASVASGGRVTFSAAASGSPTPTVVWQVSKSGGSTWYWLKSHNSPDYTVVSASGAENGWEFRAVFSNSSGSATTSAATLSVVSTDSASVRPRITRQPKSVDARFGSRVTLFAEAVSQPRPWEKWQISVDGGRVWWTLAGQCHRYLILRDVTGAVNRVEFRAVFGNKHGVTRSVPVRVRVR